VNRKRVALLGVVLGVVAYVFLIGVPYGPKARGDIALARGTETGQRVLFVGNSLTYWNDMPKMVSQLARGDSGARRLFVVRYTAPGWDLRRASRNDGLRSLLQEVNWDDLVLQERSSEPHPFYQALHERVASRGGRTTLWVVGAPDPETFIRAARTLPASLALVDAAFWEADQRRPGIDLRDDDEGHPNREGSFLMACLFYATLTGRDPHLSAYSAGLQPADAEFFKDVAWDVHRATSS
jgi:hypothetical protein